MAADSIVLPAIALPGLRPDSLGNYLASLGMLRLLARKWSSVRIAWRDEALHVVGGAATLDDILFELCELAAKHAWTPYERAWIGAQKESTKTKRGTALALWQASAEEPTLELLSAHAVPAARVHFNPILGSGGNAGKRDFADGWRVATDALAMPESSAATKPKAAAKGKSASPDSSRSREREEKERRWAELDALLLGKPTSWMLEKLNAASWFSDANKLYSSGQRPFREGSISPWAMALACEGLAFLAGGASRRLGARARVAGAFPFVTRAAAPSVSGEAGRDQAEVWAPIWDRPMTLPEARALFARGRAEIRGRGVLTPSAFATAIVRRGVDAGISEFRRFVLARTTSANTFEPRFEGVFKLREPSRFPVSPRRASAAATSLAMERLLHLVDRLPEDRKVGDRWRFVGLRGPIESAVLRLAADPSDPEVARAVLDAAVQSLDRLDRNRGFRERRVSWEPLPLRWLPSLFGDELPANEARLAMALVSGFPASLPFTLYRFGVDIERRRFEHPERPPARWVFRPGSLSRVLSAVLHRRTIDWESVQKEESTEEPARLGLPATAEQVSRWLHGGIDEALLARWISRLALFDWRSVPSEVRTLAQAAREPASGADLILFGLFQPLFDLRPVSARSLSRPGNLLDPESGARTPGVARMLTSLLRAGRLDAAVRLASSRYSMASAPLARTNAPWHVGEPERLLASILFPVTDRDRTYLIERWLRPQRQQGDEAHVR